MGRETQRGEKNVTHSFFFFQKHSLSTFQNRNGQGLVNGVGYSAADWSVTDTFSLAVFSKVRFFFFLRVLKKKGDENTKILPLSLSTSSLSQPLSFTEI